MTYSEIKVYNFVYTLKEVLEMKDSTKKIIITIINIVMFIGNAIIAYLQPSAPVQATTAVSMVATALCAIV